MSNPAPDIRHATFLSGECMYYSYVFAPIDVVGSLTLDAVGLFLGSGNASGRHTTCRLPNFMLILMRDRWIKDVCDCFDRCLALFYLEIQNLTIQ